MSIKKTRAHEHVDVNNLNQTLDMISGIMKRIDKVRETLKNFKTMLNQVKQIIHNKTTTLKSLENDVNQWWLHIEQSDSMKFAAIQKLKSMSDERSILSAASELTSIVNSSADIDRSIRRWGRLVKMENYSRESLRSKVIDWTRRWVQKWVDLEEAYKSLRSELLSSGKNYIQIYESRTQAEAIIDNAETVLSTANRITQKHQVLDTPPPMQRGLPAADRAPTAPHVHGANCACGDCCPPQKQVFVEPEKPKKKKKRRRKNNDPSGVVIGQQQQPALDMANMPPELMQQLMQYQSQQAGGYQTSTNIKPNRPADTKQPSTYVEPKKNNYQNMMTPVTHSVPFSTDWG